jgi:hypothetical protein
MNTACELSRKQSAFHPVRLCLGTTAGMPWWITFRCSARTRNRRTGRLACSSWRWSGRAWRSFSLLGGGSVWHGTATRLSDIYISCFGDYRPRISLIDPRVKVCAPVGDRFS